MRRECRENFTPYPTHADHCPEAVWWDVRENYILYLVHAWNVWWESVYVIQLSTSIWAHVLLYLPWQKPDKLVPRKMITLTGHGVSYWDKCPQLSGEWWCLKDVQCTVNWDVHLCPESELSQSATSALSILLLKSCERFRISGAAFDRNNIQILAVLFLKHVLAMGI